MAKVKVTDFVVSSKRYAKKSVTAANKDKNAYLTKAEAKALPKDLRDNYNTHRKLAQKNQRASAKKFTENFGKYVAVKARKADANKDGFIDEGAETRALPRDLRDNAKNFVFATTMLSRVATHVSPSRAALFDALEGGVEAHQWHGLLPLFDKDNRVGQYELGINDYQYLAEGLGLHMEYNQLPGSVTSPDALNKLISVKLNRSPVETTPQTERYTGKATLKGGKTLDVELFIKPVANGFVIDPPVG